MGATVGIHIDQKQMADLKRSIQHLSFDLQGKQAIRILSLSSLPIRKAAKQKAKSKIKPNSGFTFTRHGTSYTLLPGTVQKSIKNIVLKRAAIPMIDVGYSAKGKYDGWFAHFIDAGTANRKTSKGANRGKIASRNIMRAGVMQIPTAQKRIERSIDKIIKKHNR